MPPLPSGGIRYFRKWLFDTQAVEDNLALGIVRDVAPKTSRLVAPSSCSTSWSTSREKSTSVAAPATTRER
jgi:hypothetical protein